MRQFNLSDEPPSAKALQMDREAVMSTLNRYGRFLGICALGLMAVAVLAYCPTLDSSFAVPGWFSDMASTFPTLSTDLGLYYCVLAGTTLGLLAGMRTVLRERILQRRQLDQLQASASADAAGIASLCGHHWLLERYRTLVQQQGRRLVAGELLAMRRDSAAEISRGADALAGGIDPLLDHPPIGPLRVGSSERAADPLRPPELRAYDEVQHRAGSGDPASEAHKSPSALEK